MAIKNRGFTLLIAIIFMSVVLALGLALGSLGYKQSVLSNSARESQIALYAADAGLECALRADQAEDAFNYANAYDTYGGPIGPNGLPGNFSLTCASLGTTVTNLCYNSAACPNQWKMQWTIPMAYPNPVPVGSQVASAATRCAVVTIYKGGPGGTTYIFSQGYDIKCSAIGSATVFASRGLSQAYQN